jgi:hypothetical protein
LAKWIKVQKCVVVLRTGDDASGWYRKYSGIQQQQSSDTKTAVMAVFKTEHNRK